jgi:hypothetical protein
MAHESTFQEMPERQSEVPNAGALRSEDEHHERMPEPGPGSTSAASAAGTAGVTLGVSGMPDREALQESSDPGTANLGAALQRPDGLGGTRGDDKAFNKLPGEVSGAGGTTGSGAGTGNLEGKRG